jgi:hypothetical protein
MGRQNSLTRGPALVTALETDDKLPITVVFTTVPATLAALKDAAILADKLNARITLIVPQVVPFPAPLEVPPVAREFNEHRFRVMARDARVDMDVRICLCRDQCAELRLLLPVGSIIVLGGRGGRFWPDKDARLARSLGRAGYEVIFRKTE